MLAGAAALALLPAAASADVATYLKARAADADGRVDLAAADYARVLAAAPASASVALRAYREALAAGDDALVAKAAATLRTSNEAPGDLALLPLSEAARRGDPAAAEQAIAALGTTPLALLIPALQGWVAQAGGQDPVPALNAAVTGAKDPLARRFAAESLALLLIGRGDVAPGLAAIQAASASAPLDLRVSAAELLLGQGRTAEAQRLLAGDGPVLTALRRSHGAKPTLAFGVSRLLARIGADLAGGDAPPALLIALTRASLRADPGYDRARLLLAEGLARDGAPDRALATLAEVAPASPYADPAAAARVAVLSGAGRRDEALAAARGLAERPGSTALDWQRYGDRLLLADRFADAATWFRRIVDADQAEPAWTGWMQYGGALDQAGDWKRAEPALEKAVALGPDEPLALNYLGYARAERGDDLKGAIRLLERASTLAPNNASITDSLGWAYYLGGDTARALPLVEKAAAGEPTNSEVTEHLGDLYWTVGRRYEARYAWRAAAVTADAADAQRLADKLANGLAARRR